MREIKFRAWDKEFKKWSETPLDYKIKSINYYTDYEWCQYTGLKDKNGVEIYEGDVYRFEDHNFVVIYNLGSFGCFENELFYPLGAIFYKRGKVIGNIYENPELLKEEEE